MLNPRYNIERGLPVLAGRLSYDSKFPIGQDHVYEPLERIKSICMLNRLFAFLGIHRSPEWHRDEVFRQHVDQSCR